ncbi:iron ABC transporter permease [Roseomonas alkaliterrae]|jgi:iron(III) transport system permease protein|uniref:Iron(III) transport system permease protein n=1 Tax=Neoroseomonas alkaliterrae TaxID=1452450 RepID=A0A840XKP5_9PROT|nr:iron ABC transporter permease [Neoroseomonas alkaliterrae]MBB5689108.1 iron(III) transport system permease protein [Neoroseomonas alkaliterrae]MBR0675269.1 iron ABC transporter permease [Neoroseomonas alkaliterrae]
MTRILSPALPAPPRRRVPAWAWASFLVAACIAAPLLAVAVTAATRPGASFLHIATTTLPEMLANSALLVLLVALMAGSAGAISAWIVSTCEFRFRRVLEVALLLPLAMPAYLNGYVYTWLFDVAGPVQQGFRDLTGLRYGEYWAPEIRSLPGAALMLAMVLYPYVYLLCRAAFLQQSVCLVEASRTLGHGLPRTFLHVALPLARPALAAGIALALMETLADFGTVQHFGVRTFTTGIYEAWFGMDDRGAAAQLSVALLGCVFLLLALERISRGDRRFHPTTTRHPPLRAHPLHGWREAAAILACGAPVLLGFGVPAGALAWLAVTSGDPLAPQRFLPFALNSLTLSGITAAIAVAIAALMAWAARMHPSPARVMANRIAAMGYALPGSVIAVGTLVPFGLFDNALDAFMRERFGVSTGLLLSGTMAALVFAYLVRFLAVALSSVESGLARLKPSLFAAARVLGRTPGQAVREVELPLARGALLTAAVLVFVDTMKELPATLIVRPFDLDTLAVRVYNLASDERLAEASTAALLIVLVGLLPVAALTRAMRRQD